MATVALLVKRRRRHARKQELLGGFGVGGGNGNGENGCGTAEGCGQEEYKVSKVTQRDEGQRDLFRSAALR